MNRCLESKFDGLTLRLKRFMKLEVDHRQSNSFVSMPLYVREMRILMSAGRPKYGQVVTKKSAPAAA